MKDQKIEWYLYMVIIVFLLLFASIIYSIHVIKEKSNTIRYESVTHGTKPTITNFPQNNGYCGDGICQPNEKVGSIIYCGYDCYN